MEHITLRAIDQTNWEKICGMNPGTGSQNFVADNAYSIAQSMFEKSWTIKAIYADEQPIGFAMYGLGKEEILGYELCRFMIDKSQQGKGYGKKALAVIIEEMFRQFDCDRLYLSTSPQNFRAQALYKSMGFVPTGESCGDQDDIEDIYCLLQTDFYSQKEKEDAL